MSTANSFTEKRIELEIALKNSVFNDTGNSTVRLKGLRVSAEISKNGGDAMNMASIRVWGLTRSMMNDLSYLGRMPQMQSMSSIALYAGDKDGMSMVFSGDVNSAFAEYQSAPDVPFSMTAQSGIFPAVKPADAVSYKGAVDVATIMEQLAKSMGYTFENNGVSVMLDNPNFPGSDRDKAAAAARAARIEWMIDDGVLAIWPRNRWRNNAGDIPLLSPATGLVGYPTYNTQGIEVHCLFNPAIRFGTRVRVQSSLPQASKLWYVYLINHSLESMVPGGQWFSNLLLTEADYGGYIQHD